MYIPLSTVNSQVYSVHSSLMWLSLYNCTQLKNHVRFVNLLLNFKKLVHLDISKRPSESSDLNESLIIVTSHTLAELACLPMLASLDISGIISQKYVLYLLTVKSITSKHQSLGH